MEDILSNYVIRKAPSKGPWIACVHTHMIVELLECVEGFGTIFPLTRLNHYTKLKIQNS